MNRDDVMNIFSNIIKTYNENNIGLKGMNLGFFSLYLNKLLKETDNGIIVVTPTIFFKFISVCTHCTPSLSVCISLKSILPLISSGNNASLSSTKYLFSSMFR